MVAMTKYVHVHQNGTKASCRGVVCRQQNLEKSCTYSYFIIFMLVFVYHNYLVYSLYKFSTFALNSGLALKFLIISVCKPGSRNTADARYQQLFIISVTQYNK